MFDQYYLFWLLEVIREKGLEKVTVDMLVTEITPKARCKFIFIIAKMKICITVYVEIFMV